MKKSPIFADTKILLKAGEFNIRVYNEMLGKETVVLWTNNLNKDLPVLVRVQSECFTGEVLCSLHCEILSNVVF